MKLSKILSDNKLSLSFEVFPPKTDTAFDSVKHATEEIAKLKPSFMSVTYGAGGGTSRYTLEIAKNIKLRYAPELIFKFDNSFDYGAKMDALIDSLDIKPADPEDEDEE